MLYCEYEFLIDIINILCYNKNQWTSNLFSYMEAKYIHHRPESFTFKGSVNCRIEVPSLA